MSDVLTALTALAESVFRGRANASEPADAWVNSLFDYDAVLNEAERKTFLLPEW